MSWWQMASFVVGSIIVLAVGTVTMMIGLWRRQERKDGLR